MTFVKVYSRYLEYPFGTLRLFDGAGLFKAKCGGYNCFGNFIEGSKIWPYFFFSNPTQEHLLGYIERVCS